MSASLADRLREQRRKQFVGREDELQLFEGIITHAEPSIAVLHINGQGGVGKTTLLNQFELLAQDAGIRAIRVDARDLQPTPESIESALAEALTDPSRRTVLMIDTWEELDALEGWLRNQFLPKLPGQTLTVLAGRGAPSLGWRTDPDWTELLKSITLENLSEAQAGSYLGRRQVPAEHHSDVLMFTKGHPLALSLVADMYHQEGFVFRPQASPDVIETLIERFLLQVPGPEFRFAVEVCAVARRTTEALLASVMPPESASRVFQWLRSLSFIETSVQGLFPHDLARDSIVLELRWRNPEHYVNVHAAIRGYYNDLIARSKELKQEEVLFDYVFLHRHNPVVTSFFQFDAGAEAFADRFQPKDLPSILSLVEKYEGIESRKLAEFWIRKQPKNVIVVREAHVLGEGHPLLGFFLLLDLTQVSESDRAVDPAVQKALEYLQSEAQLGTGEKATFFRFWMSRDEYQDVSTAQSIIFVHTVRYCLTERALAVTFSPMADPEFWAPAFEFASMARVAELDFSIGGKSYGIFSNDWRKLTPEAWLQVLSEKEVQLTPKPAEAARAEVNVLGEAEFKSAVAEALKTLLSPARIRKSLLLNTRFVAGNLAADCPVEDKIKSLRESILEVAGSFRYSPQDAKLFRAIDAMYFHPKGSQEQAAEAIEVSIATFRRHLKEGVERIAVLLWEKELRA